MSRVGIFIGDKEVVRRYLGGRLITLGITETVFENTKVIMTYR